MDYSRQYNLIINKAKERVLEEYSETHHIIPKCLGGTNENTNLVELTPREHLICHRLLVKMYPSLSMKNPDPVPAPVNERV